MSKILLISDFVSRGKIAGNMMEPVLSYSGHDVFFLPSALISNNFSMGKVAIFDTSDYIKNSLKVWQDLDFNFDVIFLGYINDMRQKNIILSYIETLEKKPLIVFDPIMGDNDKLYKGVDEEKINIYKEFLDIADITMPNITEAKFLGLDDFDKLSKNGKKYIITSLEDENGFYNLVIDKNPCKIYYKKIDHNFAGTGDLLDALFIKYYLKIKDFTKANQLATDKIFEILTRQKNDHPDDMEIFIEEYLKLLDEEIDFAGK